MSPPVSAWTDPSRLRQGKEETLAASSQPGYSSRLLGWEMFPLAEDLQREGGRRRKVGEITEEAAWHRGAAVTWRGSAVRSVMVGSGADGETWSRGYACQWKHTCSRTSHLLRSCLRD